MGAKPRCMPAEQFCVLTTTESRVKIKPSKMHLSPPPPPEANASARSKVLVLLLYYLLFNVLSIVSSPEPLSRVVCRPSSTIASRDIS